MGPHPATIPYHREARRLALIEEAARYRLVKQATATMPGEIRFGGIARTARRMLATLTAISIRLHTKPVTLELPNR